MNKQIAILLCILSWNAWGRPETSLEELRSIDRRGKTWKTSITAPADNQRWLADLDPDQFSLRKVSSLKGVWHTGAETGVATLPLPQQWNDQVLLVEFTGTVSEGSFRLEACGQQLLAHSVPADKSGGERKLEQRFNLNVVPNGELRFSLAPGSRLHLHRIRVYQLK